MAELTIEFIRACEEMALRFTTLENFQTVAEFVNHVLAAIGNAFITIAG